MNKILPLSILISVLAIGGMVFLLRGGRAVSPAVSTGTQTNVAMVDGKQVIQISAKGGYAPRNTLAKANTPTVLHVQTNGTYDCSSALTVPAVGFRKNLPASGTTVIEIPSQPAGAKLRGVCSMGMYSFVVNFE